MKASMRILVFGILALSVCMSVHARRQRTTRARLVPTVATEIAAQAQVDTIVPDSGAVELRGYQKPLRARRESVFATNRTDGKICGIVLEIDYFDASGRNMHRRQVNVPCDIPQGETRLLDFASWDKQCVWFYKHSEPARVFTDAYPYDVKIKIVGIVAPRRQN